MVRPPQDAAAPTSDDSAGDDPTAPEATAGAGVPLGGRTPSGDAPTDAVAAAEWTRSTLLADVQSDPRTQAFLEAADRFLDAQGLTEHGTRHASLVGHIAFNVLTYLGHDARVAELAGVAGYLHDIGNVVSRANHGQSSAWLACDLLSRLEVPPADIAEVMSAVGNHEESYGEAVSPVAAAVILADKSDVHRSRVRKNASIEMDIHDRVNHAVTSSFLRVDAKAKTVTLELEIDTAISQVLEYFEIFLERMIMCRRAGRVLGCDFRITVNDVPVL